MNWEGKVEEEESWEGMIEESCATNAICWLGQGDKFLFGGSWLGNLSVGAWLLGWRSGVSFQLSESNGEVGGLSW